MRARFLIAVVAVLAGACSVLSATIHASSDQPTIQAGVNAVAPTFYSNYPTQNELNVDTASSVAVTFNGQIESASINSKTPWRAVRCLASIPAFLLTSRLVVK